MSDADAQLQELRPTAFAIAYRMLGSVSEAEDVVQESLLRFHRAQSGGRQIESPRAYLATVTTRLAIDELRSARARRESYVGEWLPEPIVTDPAGDPAARAEMADSLSMAMLVLLETLSPEQRAVLLLHDVFDYPYADIADIIGKREDNVRQLATRARQHVAARRPRFETSSRRRDELAERFFAAAEGGDLQALEEVLAEDVVLHGDGGGKVPALGHALHGRARVARTLVAWTRLRERFIGAGSIRPMEINGQPGGLLLAGEALVGVWSLDIVDGAIYGIRSIVNPDKLRHLGEVIDLGQFLPKPARPSETTPAPGSAAGPGAA